MERNASSFVRSRTPALRISYHCEAYSARNVLASCSKWACRELLYSCKSLDFSCSLFTRPPQSNLSLVPSASFLMVPDGSEERLLGNLYFLLYSPYHHLDPVVFQLLQLVRCHRFAVDLVESWHLLTIGAGVEYIGQSLGLQRFAVTIEDRGQFVAGIKGQRDMILDVEAGLLAHILDVVSQVTYQALFAQFWRNCCFQRNNVAALLRSYKAWTSGSNHLNLIRCEFNRLAIKRKMELASLAEELCSLLCAMRVQRFEFCQDFLD